MLYWHGKVRTYYNAAEIECADRKASKLLLDYNHRIVSYREFIWTKKIITQLFDM